MADILVVGGGVIGLSIAYELAGQGVEVALLERDQFGREASWAGAGILPPGNPQGARTPEAQLRAQSHVLWSAFSHELYDATGIDNGYRNCGGVEIAFTSNAPQLADDVACWHEEGVIAESLSRTELLRLEPRLSPEIAAGYRLPELSQVRNPRHLKALIAGCAARGVVLQPGTPVTGFDCKAGSVTAVRTMDRHITAGSVVIAGGAWTRAVLEQAGCSVSIEPVRGQIVMLAAQPLPFAHILQVGARYLVPRPDGRILVGSTEERVGFSKQNTAAAVAELIRFATAIVPSLGDANFERAWSGLRPCSQDGLPYLGQVPGMENLFVAAGHFRSGLQMSPGTALLMRQLILGEETCIPLDGFACDRNQVDSHLARS